MMGDPGSTTRTWQQVMDAIAQTETGDTKLRWERAMRENPFDSIRHLKLIETQPDHFLQMFSTGTVCTNIFFAEVAPCFISR